MFSVRLWGLDVNSLPFMETARATSISISGALIQGFRRQVRLGELLEMQLGEEKGQFRVVWVGRGRKLGEVGLESVSAETALWDLNLGRCAAFAAHG